MLQDAFDRAAEERSCQLVTVLGTAGVGKSRLVAEFLAGLEEATICAGRCLSYGEGVTYWALAEVVKSLAGVDEGDSPDDVRARLAALVEPDSAGEVCDGVGSLIGLAGASARVEDARLALRRLCEAVAARLPLVVAFDDIHWAEAPLLDLIDDLADWLTDVPVLLLCTARTGAPGRAARMGRWEAERDRSLLLSRSPRRTAGRSCVQPARRRSPRASSADLDRRRGRGQPAVRRGAASRCWSTTAYLRRVDDGQSRSPARSQRVALPPTIQALLTARLDRLSDAGASAWSNGRRSRDRCSTWVRSRRSATPRGRRHADACATLARKQLFRSDQPALPRPGRLSVPAHPDPRGRVRAGREGGALAMARGLRRLAARRSRATA